MPVSISGTNGVTFPDSSLQTAAASPYGLKNRIINGDMRIDQRNAGATVAFGTSYAYSVDRWNGRLQTGSGSPTIGQSTTAPTGFYNSLLITNGTGGSPTAASTNALYQGVEGYNTVDLNWGTANAKTVTLSFWVRSSLTGTFSGSLQNGNSNRSYPFTYTISLANTFEYKTITIAGDTTGTWDKTTAAGFYLWIDLGSGTNYQGTAGAWGGADYRAATGSTQLIATTGATFYITGVQVEQNTSATPFERRLYNQELANCQRYYTQSWGSGAFSAVGNAANGTASNGSNAVVAATFQVSMRAAPTVTLYDNTGASGKATQPFIANNLAATAGGIGINGFKDVSGSGYTSNSAFFANYIASIEL